MPSILIHFFILISSLAGKCFGGWQTNLSTEPMFLNSPSFPSGCCPCIVAQVENKEGRWGWTRQKKKSGGIIQAWGMRLWTLKGPHGSDSSWKKSLLSSGKKLLMAISAPRSDLYWLAVYISNKWAFNCRVGFLYCYPDGGCKSLLLLLSL